VRDARAAVMADELDCRSDIADKWAQVLCHSPHKRLHPASSRARTGGTA
jgi:hypothetical protein